MMMMMMMMMIMMMIGHSHGRLGCLTAHSPNFYGCYQSQHTVQSINQSVNLFCHTQTQLAIISIANTFRLCVTGSTQGAYAPHKRATHVP